MDELRFEITDGIATLVLNRPEVRNALNPGLRDALADAVRRIERDRDIGAVILTGAGTAFCAGGDVKRMDAHAATTPEDRLVQMRAYHALIRGLADLDRPVVAAVDGPAYGAGFGLALLADIVVASDRARFCMAFQRVGLVPDFAALYTLPRVVGLQRAKELAYTAREIDAHEALALGIVLEVVSADRLMARAREIAGSLAGASPVALGLTKRALGASLHSDLATMLDMEASAQAIAATSDYARDAYRRFVTKTPLRFSWKKLERDA